MCMLQSANIVADGEVFLGRQYQSHGKIAEEHLLAPPLQAARAGRSPSERFCRFELTPWNWRGKSLGPEAWLDEPKWITRRLKDPPKWITLKGPEQNPDKITPTFIEYVDYEGYDAPDAVMEAGQALADKLVMAEDKVDGLPWITIVRSGKHHLKHAEYLVTYGDSEVTVKDVKQVWAFDDSHVIVDNCMLYEMWYLVEMRGRGAIEPFIAEHFLVFDHARISFPEDGRRGKTLRPWVKAIGPREVATAFKPSGRLVGV